MAFSLTNKFNITDNAALEIDGPIRLSTAVSAANIFCSWRGPMDNDLTNFEITKNGHLKKVQALNDAANPAFELGGAHSVATAKVGTKTFLLATADDDNGISSFQVSKHSRHLINRDNVDIRTMRPPSSLSAPTVW